MSTLHEFTGVDLQSFGAMMLGGGGVGAGAAGDTLSFAANGAGSVDLVDASVVISKRDNSVPSVRASDADDDSAANELVRTADANKLVTGRSDPRRRIPPPPAVTGTPKPPTTELDDLLISVKTTKSYHDTRLEMIIKTWYQLAKEQVRTGRKQD
uniref:Fringe-like glycosyltransferase domain-containing protein n=1 Tax=Anopheles dirus TaxID=7168 RepID=A0A182NJ52_9DIPT